MIKSCKFNTHLSKKKERQNKRTDYENNILQCPFPHPLSLSFSFPNFCVPCWVTGNTNSRRNANEAELVHIHEAVVLMRDSITGPHYTEPVTLQLSEIERERQRLYVFSISFLHFQSAFSFSRSFLVPFADQTNPRCTHDLP